MTNRAKDSASPAVHARRLTTILAVAIGVVCVYGMRRVDPDLYGYLTYGRLFLERGSLTGNDPFAYTSADSHWVTFEYIAQIALWLAYHWWGPPGLIVLKCLLGGVALWLAGTAGHHASQRAVASRSATVGPAAPSAAAVSRASSQAT